jgi:hypothetical protein
MLKRMGQSGPSFICAVFCVRKTMHAPAVVPHRWGHRLRETTGPCARGRETVCALGPPSAPPHLAAGLSVPGSTLRGGTISHLEGSKILYRTSPASGRRKNHKSYDTRLHAVSMPGTAEITLKTRGFSTDLHGSERRRRALGSSQSEARAGAREQQCDELAMNDERLLVTII